jgi:hypothetical protein
MPGCSTSSHIGVSVETRGSSSTSWVKVWYGPQHTSCSSMIARSLPASVPSTLSHVRGSKRASRSARYNGTVARSGAATANGNPSGLRHVRPRLAGCFGSPRTAVRRPSSSTSASRPQPTPQYGHWVGVVCTASQTVVARFPEHVASMNAL